MHFTSTAPLGGDLTWPLLPSPSLLLPRTIPLLAVHKTKNTWQQLSIPPWDETGVEEVRSHVARLLQPWTMTVGDAWFPLQRCCRWPLTGLQHQPCVHLALVAQLSSAMPPTSQNIWTQMMTTFGGQRMNGGPVCFECASIQKVTALLTGDNTRTFEVTRAHGDEGAPSLKAHPEFGGRRERVKKCSSRHREVILTSVYITEIDGQPREYCPHFSIPV